MPQITETVIGTNADRFVTPTVEWKRGCTSLALSVPTLNDAALVTLEVAPKKHNFNYPAVDGDYATSGIVAEWRFDDADGTTITDEVSGITLTEQGDPTFQASAATAGLGKGVTLDGTGDAFDILVADLPDSVKFGTGDFSVEVVANLTSGSGGAGDTIICCRTGADGVGWQLQLDANEHLDVHIEDADGQVAQEGATDVATDAIVHILCSFDRDGNLVTYLNGSANATTSIATAEKTITPAAGASNRLAIGGDAARTAGDCLFGTIYFVRLYNKALTAAEALNNYRVLMNQGYPGWAPLLDQQDGDDLAVVKSGSTPGVFDLTPYRGALEGKYFRAKCGTEQTTTPQDLTFGWIFD